MSEIAETAQVTLIAADFASVDAVGKLNMIGGSVTITGINPATGLSAPLTMVCIVAVEPRFVGQDYSFEIALYGSDGQVVSNPGPMEPQPVRMAQVVRVNAISLQGGQWLPADAVWPSSQIILNFQNGLPVSAGSAYEWRVSVDGEVKHALHLGVVGPPPTVIG